MGEARLNDQPVDPLELPLDHAELGGEVAGEPVLPDLDELGGDDVAARLPRFEVARGGAAWRLAAELALVLGGDCLWLSLQGVPRFVRVRELGAPVQEPRPVPHGLIVDALDRERSSGG